MKITGFETIVVKLPRRTSYTWRSLQTPIGHYVILRLETDEGIVGLGEAPAILSWGGEHGRYFGEDPDIVCHLMRDCIAPFLVGADPFEIRPLLAKLDVHVRGFPYTKAMLESALLDIAGRALGVPVYKLLGGAMRTTIPLCHSVGIAKPADSAREAEAAVADGIGWLQIKIPGEPATDLAIVKAVRKAVGAGVKLFPDVNRGYKDAKTAIRSILAMQEAADILAIEQPVEGQHLMQRIVDSVDIPIVVDEGCWTPQDAMEIARTGAADVLSIYFTKSGGLMRSMQIGTIAQAAGLPVNVNGSLEGGVGNAANLHLAAALEGTMWPAIITVNTLAGREQTKVGGVFYTDDVITEPFEYRKGALTVPDRPGLGVDLDPKKIRKYRVG
ncbi:MAG: enolase C-terminal domain-like protein [Burkholderiales bacterium]